MQKAASLLILTFLIGACQTGGLTYGDTLRPWIGQPEGLLQQSWGIPHDVFYVTPNEKVVTYLEFSTKPLNGDSEPYRNEVYYPAIATPDYGFPDYPLNTNYYCKTTFTIINGIVSNYSFNGDDCVVRK